VVYARRMKVWTPRKIIGLLMLVASALLMFVAGTSQRPADWDVFIVAAVLMFAGIWVGQFKFRKNQGKTDA
jgi:hypothetical protein